MKNDLTISLNQARELLLYLQLDKFNNAREINSDHALSIIEDLGYIQIDTISVIERAHHHTLWTRYNKYIPNMLDELLSRDRKIFEYWGHAASYLPMRDYPYYRLMMERFPRSGSREENWINANKTIIEHVYKRIKEEGPLASKDFKSPDGSSGGVWWSWKPAKSALEMLLYQGKLMVTRRHNFQRIYDLKERVLPTEIEREKPTENERGYFFVRRALRAYGIALQREIRDHIQALNSNVLTQSLFDLIANQEVISIRINEYPEKEYYILSENVELFDQIPSGKRKVYILSPFDNMIIQRNRIKQLFDFDYTLECYVPARKRVYGYFCLPILYGKRFIGRIDLKVERKKKQLVIRNLHFEKGFSPSKALLISFRKILVDFSQFNKCKTLSFEGSAPHIIPSSFISSLS